ncbi:MAG: HAD family hydrolase [Gammaproteobacteria bacterium]|nr:HAD family hydrolase [Gammaproteobacteria bacterium]
MSTAVLFDLDDTLIDLQYARRHGLRAVQRILPELNKVPLDELELAHDAELTANYQRTLEGNLSDEEAHLEHMCGICRRYGLATDKAADAVEAYVHEQQFYPRLVPGVEELFDALRGRMKIGVITNGRSQNQRDKLEFFDLLPLDTVAISEEVGALKPNPEIFRYALENLDVQKATMVGDSWERDVLGAIGIGMDAIWLNRYRRPCPDRSLAVEINGFEPIRTVLRILRITS